MVFEFYWCSRPLCRQKRSGSRYNYWWFKSNCFRRALLLPHVQVYGFYQHRATLARHARRDFEEGTKELEKGSGVQLLNCPYFPHFAKSIMQRFHCTWVLQLQFWVMYFWKWENLYHIHAILKWVLQKTFAVTNFINYQNRTMLVVRTKKQKI